MKRRLRKAIRATMLEGLPDCVGEEAIVAEGAEFTYEGPGERHPVEVERRRHIITVHAPAGPFRYATYDQSVAPAARHGRDGDYLEFTLYGLSENGYGEIHIAEGEDPDTYFFSASSDEPGRGVTVAMGLLRDDLEELHRKIGELLRAGGETGGG